GFSQDDVNNRRRRRYQAGKPSGSCRTNALRTTRSTLAILRDDAAFLSLAENRGAREYKRWIGFSQDDVGNRRRRKYQAGKPHANALRTTRSTLAILRDDTVFIPLAENGSTRE